MKKCFYCKKELDPNDETVEFNNKIGYYHYLCEVKEITKSLENGTLKIQGINKNKTYDVPNL